MSGWTGICNSPASASPCWDHRCTPSCLSFLEYLVKNEFVKWVSQSVISGQFAFGFGRAPLIFEGWLYGGFASWEGWDWEGDHIGQRGPQMKVQTQEWAGRTQNCVSGRSWFGWVMPQCWAGWLTGWLTGGNCERIMRKHGVSPSLLSVVVNTAANLVGEGFLWLLCLVHWWEKKKSENSTAQHLCLTPATIISHVCKLILCSGFCLFVAWSIEYCLLSVAINTCCCDKMTMLLLGKNLKDFGDAQSFPGHSARAWKVGELGQWRSQLWFRDKHGLGQESGQGPVSEIFTKNLCVPIMLGQSRNRQRLPQ